MEPAVRLGIERLEAAGIPGKHLMFYILCGFGTTIEEDLSRIEIVREFGADPFVMKYNNKQDPTLNALARWANKRICEQVPFSEYTRKRIGLKQIQAFRSSTICEVCR